MLKVLMGCVSGRPQRLGPPDGPPEASLGFPTTASLVRRFPVTTLGGRGQRSRGYLEVSETFVRLRRSRHPDVTWPLHFLRRYGHEPGVFSFESGRRCESGPGIFTFHSPQAEEIFQLVQQHIQASASAQLALGPSASSDGRYVEGRLARHRLSSLAADSLTLRPTSPSNPDGDYLRPNSLQRPPRHHSAGEAMLSGGAESGSEDLPPVDLALVDLSPSRGRPVSLSLPSAGGSTLTEGRTPSPGADNVFASPRDQPNYINVELEERNAATPTPTPFRHRHCVSEIGTAGTGSLPRPEAYVNLSSGLAGAAPLDYVMLKVGEEGGGSTSTAGTSSTDGGLSSEPSTPGPTAALTAPAMLPSPKHAQLQAPGSNYALIDTAKTRALKAFAREPLPSPRNGRSRHDSAL